MSYSAQRAIQNGIHKRPVIVSNSRRSWLYWARQLATGLLERGSASTLGTSFVELRVHSRRLDRKKCRAPKNRNASLAKRRKLVKNSKSFSHKVSLENDDIIFFLWTYKNSLRRAAIIKHSSFFEKKYFFFRHRGQFTFAPKDTLSESGHTGALFQGNV